MPPAKVALITGGAKRVGRAIAHRLADAGYAVAFTYNQSSTDAIALAQQLNALPIQADLTQPAIAIEQITKAFHARFDRLDLLVNNASLYEPAPLEQTELNLTRKMMAIHYESPLLLCKHFAPLLRQATGHIINMVDLMVEHPAPRYVAYTASKAALWNLTLTLSRELAPDVTVNAIAPGVVEWPPGYPLADQQNYLKRVPLARPGTPTDVAETVHFLATKGSYITGQIIRLDGGRSVT
jgi:pteridine reductase